MAGRLKDKVALVTGGAKGIGRSFAEAMAGEGATVAIADIADGAEAVAAIEGLHGKGRAFFIRTDVSDEAAVKAMTEAIIKKAGKIDVLVNNAALFATLPPTPFADIEVGMWDKVFSINVRGAFLVIKHVVPIMTARKSGKVINTGSGTVYKGMPGLLHYVASKGAISAMTKSLSREVGAHGVCVNTLAPGLTLSSSVMDNIENHEMFKARVESSRAIPRQAYPDDLVGALIFLASDESNFMTGQTIAVDGGSINT
jgi:NAD(P)-dependent dehydrogenase (short-subunit alcohol dehydrogenase family)